MKNSEILSKKRVPYEDVCSIAVLHTTDGSRSHRNVYRHYIKIRNVSAENLDSKS